MRVFGFLLFVLFIAGCANRQTFQIVVTNRMPMPITVGPVKDGPPYEPNWGTVEEWSMGRAGDEVPAWGMVVPPGRTADSGKLEASFETGTRAFVRVYRGEHSNIDLMAMSEGPDSRVTLSLIPGLNRFEVVEEGIKGMVVKRLTPGP
jgi:hypothetical protein